MSILDKLVDKFICPDRYDRLNLENFLTNLKYIVKDAKKRSIRLLKDSEKRFFDQGLEAYQEGELDIQKKIQDTLFAQTNSESYSVIMSTLIHVQRVYALYFMFGDNSRTVKARKKMRDNLVDIYDLCAYAVLKYFVCERSETVVWANNQFYYPENSEGKDTILQVCNIMSNVSRLIKAIVNNDNTAVYEIYQKLDIEGATQTSTADAIFDL